VLDLDNVKQSNQFRYPTNVDWK